MSYRGVLTAFCASAVLLSASEAGAQTSVSLPDTSQSTTFSATVSEQARVIVPATVVFTVNDVASATNASAAAVTIDQIVLASATKQLRVSLQANAASFTAPGGSGTTWSASDVTWNAASWSNGTGASGSLSAAAFNSVATCSADTTDCSTTGLVFTLGAKPTVNRAGTHTLTVTWKFESIGS